MVIMDEGSNPEDDLNTPLNFASIKFQYFIMKLFSREPTSLVRFGQRGTETVVQMNRRA